MLSGKESACQCRRHEFSPWVGKIAWRRKRQPTPVFLPGKSHRQRRLAGYNPWGHRRVRHNLVSKQQGGLEPRSEGFLEVWGASPPPEWPPSKNDEKESEVHRP